MYREHITHHSEYLNRDMNILIHGTGGTPILVFPCQDSMCNNFEEFGMIDTLQDYLEEEKIQLFSVDTVDKESFSDTYGDKKHRIWIQECYYNYIIEEVLPLIREYNPNLPLVTGFSLGASHAAIVFLRRPDLFKGVLGLSGCYDTAHFFDNQVDELIYNNSPVHFLANMPTTHPYINLYNKKKIVFSVGQGRWNGEGIRTVKILDEIFQQKGINAWCDLWGYDVDHDWPWWKIMIRYFLPYLLEE